MTGTSPGSIQRIWAEWKTDDRRILAPALIRYELVNAFHRHQLSGLNTVEECQVFLESGLNLPIELDYDVDLHQSAFGFAVRFQLGAAYDAHYLATAEKHRADFWTCDRRLFNRVAEQLDWVHVTD